MIYQQNLFDLPSAAVVCKPRVTQPASPKMAAFNFINKSRSRLHIAILQVLSSRDSADAKCPTAREILRELKTRKVLAADAERNAVSPRLSELLKLKFVENVTAFDNKTGKRKHFLKKIIGDAPASVWRITERGRLFLKSNEEGGHAS